MEISDRREVRVSVGEKTFTFVAEPDAGRLSIREEGTARRGDGKTVCALTVADRDELHAFMEGLSRVIGATASERGGVSSPESSRDRVRPTGRSPALDDPEAIERARRRNPNAFKPWSGEEDRRLREGSQAGKSVEELASDLQRSTRAVTMRLEKLGERPVG